MSLFDLFRTKPAAKSPATNRSARPRVEELEPREVPANDILTVAGPAGQQVSVHFEFLAHHTVLWNEIGVYKVDDAQGRVDDKLPGDAGYAAAALAKAQVVFAAGDLKGETQDLSFTAGTRLAYYLIQNNTSDIVKESNPGNRARFGNQAFFSIDIVNRDRFDHLKTRSYGDRSMRLEFEDAFGGGDRDFDDAIVKVSFSTQGTSLALGVAGQNVPTRFRIQATNSNFKNEVGFFRVDDAAGRIGNIEPGSTGYAAAALDPARRTILFRRGSPPGAVRNVDLPGGGFFGLYLIQNASSKVWLRRNPDNLTTGRRPIAFFSFESANPDNFNHIRWLADNQFAFEDTTGGGDKDFNDFVGSLSMRVPANSAPIISAAIANINKASTAADQEIDLAGTFNDLDFANSLVRIATNKGTFDLELLDRAAPRTVANFYNYVADGDYNNVIFHRRAASPSVLQGGGVQFVNTGGVTTLPEIADDKPVANERDATNRPNVRGTIAMAKSTADNATNEFYFNLINNSVGDTVNLDDVTNTGGFTVFGRIAEGNMSVVDALAAIPTQDKGGVFNNLPMSNYNGTTFPDDVLRDNLIVINSITVLKRPEFLTFAVVSNTDANVVDAILVHNHLTLNFKNAGASTITVSATDSKGHTTTTSFTVTLT